MPKNDDLEKKTLFFRRGDWDYLESLFRPNGVATSLAIRSIISQFVDERRSRETPHKLNMDAEL